MAGQQELWRLAAQWLQQVGVLEADNPVLGRNARVYDLALALQDGTVLCNAINVIRPGMVEQVTSRLSPLHVSAEDPPGAARSRVSAGER